MAYESHLYTASKVPGEGSSSNSVSGMLACVVPGVRVDTRISYEELGTEQLAREGGMTRRQWRLILLAALCYFVARVTTVLVVYWRSNG